jgi:membrane protein YdbS with pleckstrin-like domain
MGRWTSEATDGAAAQFGRRHERLMFRWHAAKQVFIWTLIGVPLAAIIQLAYQPVNPHAFNAFTRAVESFGIYALITVALIVVVVFVARYRRNRYNFKMPRRPRGMR